MGVRQRPAHQDPRVLALIVAGGALGTLTRAVLQYVFAVPRGSWPWPTFAINLTGAFALGLLLQTLALRGRDVGRRRLVRLAVGPGFLGGYTTYSTFAVETLHLRPVIAVVYAGGTVLLGALAAGAGFLVANRLSRPDAAPPAQAQVSR